jgi:hypothetical protein
MTDRGPRVAQVGRITAALFGCLLLADAAPAWGPSAHRVVHSHAISALPKPLRRFFSSHRREMATLGAAPPATEGPERRFAIDRVAAFPFLDLPTGEAAFRERYGERTEALGRLPWLAQESYRRLVAAFQSRRKAQILAESDQLAALLTDLSNPLALTDNFDGQRSDQHGLWTRVAARLPEVLERRLKVKAGVAVLVDRPDEHVLEILRASYIWGDNVLYEEDLAARSAGGRGALYYDALSERLRGILEERLGAATRTVASYWYTAWVAAGKPDLTSLE